MASIYTTLPVRHSVETLFITTTIHHRFKGSTLLLQELLRRIKFNLE